MAYGKLKADTLIYDNSGSDVEVTLASIVSKVDSDAPDFTTNIELKAAAPVILNQTDNAAAVSIKAPGTGVTSYTITLPAVVGASGKVLKTSDGSGTLTWGDDTALTLLDEDNFATDSATAAASQQSVKAYVDTADALKAPLDNPVFTGTVSVGTGGVVWEGATADDFETALIVTDPTADRTITFPDATGTVALGAIGTDIQAYDADTAKLDTSQSWTAAQSGSIYDATTDASAGAGWGIDFADGNNQKVTLVAANVFTVQPTNQTVGQSGSIFITQPASGSTVSTGWHGDFKWAGATGAAQNLTQTLGATDRLDYIIAAANTIHVVLTLGVA